MHFMIFFIDCFAVLGIIQITKNNIIVGFSIYKSMTSCKQKLMIGKNKEQENW